MTKVLIIGSHGRVAQRHKKAWNELGVELFGCDSSVDYRKILTSQAYDLIDICTPIYLHAEMIKEANKLGIPVLCEKPLAINLDQAMNVVNLFGKIGIIYQFRFNPKILKLKKELEEGKYGEIKLVTAQYYRWRGPEYYKDWEGDKLKAGGGVVLNVCIHYLDLLQWLFGYPTEIKGFTTSSKKLDVEDNAVAIFRFPQGAVGSIILSTHVNPPKHFELAVYGTKGHKTIQLRQNEYHKENFEAFLNDGAYVKPMEALKSLSMALEIIK